MQTTTKNIIICVPFFSLGGAETQAYNIAKGFKEAYHNVTVVAFDEKSGLLRKKLIDLGINCELIPYQLNWIHEKGTKKFLGLLKVIFFLRKFKPDFLFPFTYYPNIIFSSIWRFTGAKKCFWNQRGLEHNAFNIVEHLAKFSRPEYLANSLTCSEYIKKRHSLKSKVQVINNGLDVLPPKNNSEFWRAKLNLKRDDKLFMMAANFYPEKNHEYLIRNWNRFCSQTGANGKKLLLIGYPAQERILHYVKSLVLDYNLNNVIFVESSNDISGLMTLSSYNILSSKSEGCSNFVLESMFFNVPILVSEISSNLEIVGNDYKYSFSIKEELGLFEKLCEVVEDANLPSVKEHNKAIVNQKYNLSLLKKSYLKLIYE